MNVVICDDEAQQAEAVRLLLENAGKKFGVPLSIRTFSDPRAMLFETEAPKTWPDLVCIDVNMPQMMGTDAVRAMRKRGQSCPVLFFSVLQDVRVLIEAFNVRATNYFLKDDLDVDRFNRVFADIAHEVDQGNQEVVVFSCGGESRSILVKQIDYFEVNKKIITVHYGAEEFSFYSRLERIATMLEGRGFVRTHRSFLVARRAIAGLTAQEVKLSDGSTLPLSRTYASDVRAALKSRDAG